MTKMRFLILVPVAAAGVVADEAPGLKAFERGDYQAALAEAAPAAEQGNAGAQLVLGGLYATGKGVPKDFSIAYDWIKKSAMQGFDEAQYAAGEVKYGGMSREGEINCSKVVQALKLQILAASQNCVESYAWHNLAAAQGHKKATERRDELNGVLNPSQILEAQKLSTKLQGEMPKK